MRTPVIVHPDRPTHPDTDHYAMFLEKTKNHELTVLHDCGLYRHIRMQKPGTRMWSWTSSPGLAIWPPVAT